MKASDRKSDYDTMNLKTSKGLNHGNTSNQMKSSVMNNSGDVQSANPSESKFAPDAKGLKTIYCKRNTSEAENLEETKSPSLEPQVA